MIRARGGVRRTVGLLILILSALAVTLTPAAVRSARAADGSPVQVIVDSVTPSVVRNATDPVVIGYRLVNTTGKNLDQVTVRARTGAPVTLRDDLADNTGDRGTSIPAIPAVDIPANGQVTRELRTTAAQFNMAGDKIGVYGLTLEAWDNGSRAGSARVLLPWFPKSDQAPTKLQVGVLWPLIDQARRDGTTIGDTGQTAVFMNDGLTAELGENGRLNRLVQIGADLPGAIWMVDPDLLATATEMVKGYRVAPPRPADDGKASDEENAKSGKGVGKDGEGDDQSSNDRNGRTDVAATKSTPRTEEGTTLGTGGPLASGWLEQLRKASQTGTVVALPCGDTDLASIAHVAADGTKTDLTPFLRRAVADGGQVAFDVLQRQVRSNVAWPIAGAVDEQVLKSATATGAELVIASGNSVPTRKTLTYTTSARAQIGSGTNALVSDARIDALLAAGATNTMSPAQLQQTLVAELLTIAIEEPARARTLLIAPPRQLSATVAAALKNALVAATDAAGWAEPATLDQLEASKPGDERTVKGYPQDLRRTEFAADYQKSVEGLQQSVDAFAAILSDPSRITAPYDPAVLRAMSVGWRTAPELDAGRYRIDVTRSLRVLEQLVRIVPKAGVTLSGDSGTIPITIINGLQQAITIRLDVASRQPNRLSLTQPPVTTIPGGVTSAIPVSAESAANGKVLVDVRMLTPDGQHTFGATHSFYVNTTSIDGITLGIIGVIAGLLALFSLRAYLRRRRAAADGDDGSDDGEGDGGNDGGNDGAAGPQGAAQVPHAQDEGDARRHANRDRPEDHHAPA